MRQNVATRVVEWQSFSREPASFFHGEVINLRDVVTFQSDSVEGLKREFRTSVDDYLDFCRERGETPEKPFSGKLTLRLAPELHRRLYLRSPTGEKSLSHWITEALDKAG